MQKNQRRAVAHYGVGDFGVAAANAIHAGIVNAPRTPRATSAPLLSWKGGRLALPVGLALVPAPPA